MLPRFSPEHGDSHAFEGRAGTVSDQYQQGDNPFRPEPQPVVEPSGRLRERDLAAGYRQYAMWTHLAPLLGSLIMVVSSGAAFLLPIIVALVMWLARKGDARFLDDHGREATNFQISLLLLFIICIPIGILTCGLGWIVGAIGIFVLSVVGGIFAAVAASKGEYYRYPMCIRLIGPPAA